MTKHTQQGLVKISIENLSFAVVGLVRNCESTIKADIYRIKNAMKNSKEVLWLIIESDSTDNTLKELKELRAQITNFYFKSLGQLASKISKRTDRISHCRNAYAEHIRNDPLFSQVDYVVVADLDGLNNKLTQEAFESCWLRNDWDMCAANQDGPYYDIWALRHKDWCPNDCWSQNKFLNTYRLDFEKNLWTSIYSKMITIPKDSEWIEVESAFGGFEEKKKHMFNECKYMGVTETGEDLCEHVFFHKKLKQKGAKLFINPLMINTGITEHTTDLLWKKRFKNKIKGFKRKIKVKFKESLLLMKQFLDWRKLK